MILHLSGETNRYYVQTLCMVFFPGAKFGESEESGPDTPIVSLTVTDLEGGGKHAEAVMTYRGKTTSASGSAYPDKNIVGDRVAKIAEGRAIFGAGKEMFRHTPPWGILTGVRPSKVASELLMMGNGIIKSKAILRDEYFVNPQKAARSE